MKRIFVFLEMCLVKSIANLENEAIPAHNDDTVVFLEVHGFHDFFPLASSLWNIFF